MSKINGILIPGGPSNLFERNLNDEYTPTYL